MMLIIDLYSGEATELDEKEFQSAVKGLKKIETDAATTYKGEEYIVVLLGREDWVEDYITGREDLERSYEN